MYSYLKASTMLNFLIILIFPKLLKFLNAWFLKKLFPEMTIDDLIKYEKEAKPMIFKNRKNMGLN
ncbi:hypothetical protein PG913_12120 [Tenacibaculum pacificus]|uniref:hypothetical protein n=1 Tax=Tenacibaculum pacificus TaxID=3018314 RepID=UPI0022F3A05C|nr:hypothetical protein [Tenacibaculum pacificus]WBX73560.1 hypothetical protein PG913_12120 [Tenacibaculum pacificus]